MGKFFKTVMIFHFYNLKNLRSAYNTQDHSLQGSQLTSESFFIFIFVSSYQHLPIYCNKTLLMYFVSISYYYLIK